MNDTDVDLDDRRGRATDRRGNATGRRFRWWHRSAGVAAAVAILVIGGTTSTGAATPRKPSGAEIAAVAAETTDGPVHGEFPVVAADGTVQTRRWQWGEVVAVDAADSADPSHSATITVASQDGYASDYRVDPARLTGIGVGDIVTVVGLVADPSRGHRLR